jgi:ribosomal protein S12 methylthiotransferase
VCYLKFFILTLGCPKNEVDSEGLASVLIEAGHVPVGSPEEADILVVNTCGFIEAAREESLAALREMTSLALGACAKGRRARRGPTPGEAQQKRKIVIAAGCLAERYGPRLAQEIGGIDGIVGTRRWAEVADAVAKAVGGENPCLTGEAIEPEPSKQIALAANRVALAPSAYVKIADGCDAGCAFCAIPSIKGHYRSRPIDAIVAEVRALTVRGVKEVILIAQDTTSYGRDLDMHDGLAILLDRLGEEVPDLPWVRILYAYPQFITPRLLETMARHSEVLKYLDLPLQHAHPATLKRMGRPTGNPLAVVERIRQALPGVALRTTFIVGFPGETDEEFAALLDLIREARFDRVGVFKYSKEEGTAAAEMADQVPEKIKQRRYDRAMLLQQGISLEINQRYIGKELDVLIEGRVETDEDDDDGELGDWVGRSFRDAPEIDGLVFVKGEAPGGQIVSVRITDALEYDLVGELAEH